MLREGTKDRGLDLRHILSLHGRRERASDCYIIVLGVFFFLTMNMYYFDNF